MKQAKAARTIAKRSGGTPTGRDGAIDFALKMLGSEAEAATDAEHVYRVIEIVGSSSRGIEDAIDAALSRARKTLRNLRWFELVRTSGHIGDGKVRHYQVTLKVGFTMEDAAA
jgi:flavin-binding protein dodecin